MIVRDRLLFLKYALPCARTLVKRGNVSQEYVDKLVDIVADGNVPEEDAEKMFKIATAMCNAIAVRMNKDEIDDDVIRKYFLTEHSPVVEDRYKLMKDFNPVDCKTYSGKVVGLEEDSAAVKTRLGTKEYRTAFAKDVAVGDIVAVHFDFIVEKISGELSEKMEELHEERN